MLTASLHKDVSDDKILAFGVALEKRIREMVADPQKHRQYHDEIVLSVDYWPCENLHAALVEAGVDIRMDVLPWKTSMRIGPTGVSVKCGYGQPFNKIA